MEELIKSNPNLKTALFDVVYPFEKYDDKKATLFDVVSPGTNSPIFLNIGISGASGRNQPENAQTIKKKRTGKNLFKRIKKNGKATT
ncbi:MAG: hypothetical protein R2784_02445 [Saprospiraceae bacterium]